MLKSSIFICFKVKLQNVRARRDQRLPKFMDLEVETLVSLHRPEQTLSHENSGCPKLPSKFLAQEEFDFESSKSQSNDTCFTILPLKIIS